MVVSLLAGLAVAAAVVWVAHHRRDESRLRRAFGEIVALCRKDGPEGPLTTAMRAQEVMTRLASNAVLQLGPPYPMTVERDELGALLVRGRAQLDTIAIATRGDEIDIDPDRQRAEMRVTVEVAGTQDGRRESGIGEYRIAWQKQGGTWKLVRVTHLETIQRPPL